MTRGIGKGCPEILCTDKVTERLCTVQVSDTSFLFSTVHVVWTRMN